MFRVMDDDGNHSLNLEEFMDGITKTGLEVNREEIILMFKQIDKDGSGSVNVNEFLEKVRVRFTIHKFRSLLWPKVFDEMSIFRNFGILKVCFMFF